MNSCLYECTLMHQRLVPTGYGFRHRVFMFYLDLDELDALGAARRLFGRQRLRPYRFCDADHVPAGRQPLRQRVRAYLATQGIALEAGARVMLLTNTRVFGYVFNPISVYFCFTPQGTPLCALAEVGNTFREKKLYLLRIDGDSRPATSGGGSVRLHRRTPKHYYVSPFSPLDLEFDFDFAWPSDRLDLRVDDYDGEHRVFLSALTGRRRRLDDAHLLAYTFKYPLLTLKVIGLIHWHALRLWCKRVPWHRKAAEPALQREVLNPATPAREP
jgi:DUF1365 family protein